MNLNNETNNSNTPIVEKKKRGRKKQIITNEVIVKQSEEKSPPKKRGRKPKGGKIIQQENCIIETKEIEPNVILHLKCSLSDLQNKTNNFEYNPNIEDIQSFNFENNSTQNFFINNDSKKIENFTGNNYASIEHNLNHTELDNSQLDNDLDDTIDKNNIKLIWKKINALKLKLHKNDISDKRSACFWCTCEFDNPPIYIPKCEFKNTYQVYGCFCTPECAAAYLMEQKIDSSAKFESYQLLNHVYGKIYNYDKNIKPAPSPYYILDKYYGNLTINEYRNLYKNEQLLIVVEKPLTHVLPELYEDNSDFILNQRSIPSNSNFKLKKKVSTNKKESVLDSFKSQSKNN